MFDKDLELRLDYKKSNELFINEKIQICALFKEVFEKPMTYESFEQKFEKNQSGFSYHGLMIEEDKIVGCYSVIPYKYRFFNQEYIFGLSVDTMIAEEYRGNPFNLKKMANLVYDGLKADGIPFVFGFPNDNVYLVRKKILKWQDIGKLDFYILPINIGAIKSKLAFLNIFSRIFAGAVNVFVGSKSLDIKAFGIEKINDQSFLTARYDASYSVETLGDDSYFAYKIYDEEGIRTAYLIDVYPLCKSSLENAVKELYKKEKNNIDLIIYVGHLNFKVKNMFKVPEKYQPKNVHMSGKILDDTIIDERIFDINNWNVNLSNYDVR